MSKKHHGGGGESVFCFLMRKRIFVAKNASRRPLERKLVSLIL